MQSTTKNSLRQRLSEWQLLQEQFFISVSRLPRPSQQDAYVAQRHERRKEQKRRRRLAAAKKAAAKTSATDAGDAATSEATNYGSTPVGGRERRLSLGGGGTSVTSPVAGTGMEPTLHSDSQGSEKNDKNRINESFSSTSESSIDTLTGCNDEEVLAIYPTLSKSDKNVLKNEDKLAVAKVAHSLEFLSAKVEFLEDMLYLYQSEVDYQIKINSSATYVKELKGDLNSAEDRVAYVSTQLRKALDEITNVKKEKEYAIQSLTAEFERTTQRERERHEIAVRDFEHEKQLLKAKIKAVEVGANDSVAAAKASSAAEAVAMRNRIDNYVSQIQALEDTVQQEQKLRTKLETDLWELNQKLQSIDKLNDLVKSCTHNLQEVIAKELRNQRHVFGEISKVFSENSRWHWQGDPNGIVALSIKAQREKKFAEAQRRAASMGISQGADGTLLMGDDGTTEAPPKHEMLHSSVEEVDLNAALFGDVMKEFYPSSNEDMKSPEHNASFIPTSTTPLAAMERFMRVADRLNVVISQYQGDLLQAVTSGCETLLKEKNDIKSKLLECYANAELQGRRTEELQRQWEGQKELASADRDRALALRDRLARQLRMDGGGHERRLTKNAECQTTIQGSAAASILATAALPSALKSGGNERRGVTIQDSRGAAKEL